MFDRLEAIEKKYDELNELMSDIKVINDHNEFQKHAKVQSDLADTVSVYREYKKTIESIEESQEMLQEDLDDDMKEMLELEVSQLTKKKENMVEELKVLLLPRDPNDDKNVVMEIRAGAGGDEASLFAANLFRMYSRYSENMGWKVEVLNTNWTGVDGIKEISFLISGSRVYSFLKYESGVHRVQRVPDTESQGRIHTSTATVAVLPEAEDVEVNIATNDIRVDVFCSSGPGGQSVNTTQSAVRITHLPTGITVSCQDEKSQHKNKDKAMKVLRARVLEKAQEEADGEMASTRKSQVGTGDRSERIRTYNYPQGRVTDHRINFTLHKLDNILLGDLNELIDALITFDQAEKLKETGKHEE